MISRITSGDVIDSSYGKMLELVRTSRNKTGKTRDFDFYE